MAGSPSSEHALTFAVASSSPGAAHHLEAMCRELAKSLSRDVVPKLLPSYAALLDEMGRGAADIAWAPPLVAIELEDEAIASIALCCSRGGKVGYHAAIFTRHGSPLEKLDDLAGRHMGWVDASSSAGYVLPRMRLTSLGLTPEKLFAKETFFGSHEKVACAVLDGVVDAGATYMSLDPATQRPISAGWLEAGAGLNGAAVLATVGPIPSDAIVLTRKLSLEQRVIVTAGLRALPKAAPDAVGGLLRADAFVAPQGAHFNELRALCSAAAGKG